MCAGALPGHLNEHNLIPVATSIHLRSNTFDNSRPDHLSVTNIFYVLYNGPV
jgi:hypothetical protein